ncbi:MAG: metallophosphoesterase, partial [Psychrobacter sp.]
MWFFIVFTQLLAVMTSVLLCWFVKPKTTAAKAALITAVFIINNVALIYGLTEFWGERFHVYLVVSILQGFMLYAALLTAVLAGVYALTLKQKPRPRAIRAFAMVIYVSIVSLAIFNSYSPVVHRLTVTINKPLDKPMDIALVSDTHLGRWFGNRQIKKMVSLIDAQHPDVVVIAGDIMNDNTIAYDNTNMHEQLLKLKAPLGVYATLGNHDYFGYDQQITQAVEEAGIKALDNESVLLDDSVWL